MSAVHADLAASVSVGLQDNLAFDRLLCRRVAPALTGRRGGITGMPTGYTEFDEMTAGLRSEEHTSELQSLMRISYAVFCLKTKNEHIRPQSNNHISATRNKKKV